MFYFIYQMDYLNLLFHALLKLIVYLLSSMLKLAQNKQNYKTYKLIKRQKALHNLDFYFCKCLQKVGKINFMPNEIVLIMYLMCLIVK